MIRPAQNQDSDEIRELVFQVLRAYGLEPAPESTDADLNDIVSSYADRGGCFDVLVDASGTIVGTVGLFPMNSERCELRKMYLDPKERGKGFGKKLLEHALRRARELGYKSVVLETASVLKEAIGLYRRHGFTPYHPDHLSDRCDQAYILEL